MMLVQTHLFVHTRNRTLIRWCSCTRSATAPTSVPLAHRQMLGVPDARYETSVITPTSPTRCHAWPRHQRIRLLMRDEARRATAAPGQMGRPWRNVLAASWRPTPMPSWIVIRCSALTASSFQDFGHLPLSNSMACRRSASSTGFGPSGSKRGGRWMAGSMSTISENFSAA